MKSQTSFAEPGLPREGFALAAALLVVLLVAALMSAVFFAAMEGTRTAAALARREAALIRAESAIEAAVRDIPASVIDTLGIGHATTLKLGDPQGPVVVYISRLDSALYSIVADTGDDALNFGASRRIGVVVSVRKVGNDSRTIDPIPERAWSELF